MKKSLGMFILLSIAGLCIFPLAFRAVDSGKGQIVVTETTVEGDVAEAEGISVEIGTHWKGKLLWNTVYRPGHVAEAVSSFDFSGQGTEWSSSNPRMWSSSFTDSGEVTEWRDLSTAYVDIQVATVNFGTARSVGSAGSTEQSMDEMPYSKLLQEAADRTAAGESSTVALRLGDYYDCYSLDFYVAGRDGRLYYENSWQEAAADFFRIPIPEGQKLEVAVQKDDEGKVIDVHCKGIGERCDLAVTSAVSASGYYFAYYLERSSDFSAGAEIDFGEQYAIYWLPCEEQVKRNSRESEADIGGLQKAVLLPEGAAPVTMKLDGEEQLLFVLARQKGQYIVLTYSVEKAELTLLSQLELPDTELAAENAEEDSTDFYGFRRMTVKDNGILLTWQDNRFAFIARDGMECRLWCTDIFPVEAKEHPEFSKEPSYAYVDYESAFPYENAFEFDGARLALAAHERWGSLDSRLLVYKEGRLVYSGYYQYSGELDAALGINDKIIPWGNNFSHHRRNGTAVNPLCVSMD